MPAPGAGGREAGARSGLRGAGRGRRGRGQRHRARLGRCPPCRARCSPVFHYPSAFLRVLEMKVPPHTPDDRWCERLASLFGSASLLRSPSPLPPPAADSSSLSPLSPSPPLFAAVSQSLAQGLCSRLSHLRLDFSFPPCWPSHRRRLRVVVLQLRLPPPPPLGRHRPPQSPSISVFSVSPSGSSSDWLFPPPGFRCGRGPLPRPPTKWGVSGRSQSLSLPPFVKLRASLVSSQPQPGRPWLWVPVSSGSWAEFESQPGPHHVTS